MPEKLHHGKRHIDEAKTVIGTGRLDKGAPKKARFNSPNSDDNTTPDNDSGFEMLDIKEDSGEEAFSASDVAHSPLTKSVPSNIFLPTPGMLYMSKSDETEESCIAMVLPYYADIGFPPHNNLSSEFEGHHEMEMSPTTRNVHVNKAFVQHFGWDLPISEGEETTNDRSAPAVVISGTPRNASVPLRSLMLFSQNPEALREIGDVDEALDLYGQIRTRQDLQALDKLMTKNCIPSQLTFNVTQAKNTVNISEPDEGCSLSDSALEQLLVVGTIDDDTVNGPYMTEGSKEPESSEGNHGITVQIQQELPGDTRPLPKLRNAVSPAKSVASTSNDTIVDVEGVTRRRRFTHGDTVEYGCHGRPASPTAHQTHQTTTGSLH
ncbi:hypothetical protein CMQ_2335 [Grosmannia clavigera kw1407]|uniref:Uncharacterized protein n=1 Tax=Grosmannia clavigera (strain kw1407 / UAMH 11150) TaxID=655863 RepID=F0XJW8_GROCL|nr:uncharacterized protein CMQ_2335 [Grosmannia clavigera kw1407]EFX02286.1 hypothetical protein CMQ_2335 [Grosmannia clavigera kw1407]